MAKSFKPIGHGTTQIRVLVNGRWLPLDRAKRMAGKIVARETKDAAKAAQERLATLLE